MLQPFQYASLKIASSALSDLNIEINFLIMGANDASTIGCASHSLTASHLRSKGTPRRQVYGNNAYAITTIYYLGKIFSHVPIVPFS